MFDKLGQRKVPKLWLNRKSLHMVRQRRVPLELLRKHFKKANPTELPATVRDWQMLGDYFIWDLCTIWNIAVLLYLPSLILEWNFCKSNPILNAHWVISHLKESFWKLGNLCIWKYWIFLSFRFWILGVTLSQARGKQGTSPLPRCCSFMAPTWNRAGS